VWRAVVNLVTQPDVLDSKLLAYTEDDPTELERRSLTRFITEKKDEHRKQSQSLMKLADALDEYTLASFTTQLKELAASIQKAEADLLMYQEQYEAWRASQRNLDEVRAMIAAVRDDMRTVLNDETPLQVRRDFMTLFGVSVQMWPVGHEPRWTMTVNLGEGFQMTSDEATSMLPVPLTSSRACRRAPSAPAPSPDPVGVAHIPS
jgi:hypothetical protein